MKKSILEAIDKEVDRLENFYEHNMNPDQDDTAIWNRLQGVLYARRLIIDGGDV